MRKQSYWETRMAEIGKKAFTGPMSSRNQVGISISLTFPGNEVHAEDMKNVKSLMYNAIRDVLPPGVLLSGMNVTDYNADKEFYSV